MYKLCMTDFQFCIKTFKGSNNFWQPRPVFNFIHILELCWVWMLDICLQDKTKVKDEIDAIKITNFTTSRYFTKRQIFLAHIFKVSLENILNSNLYRHFKVYRNARDKQLQEFV